MCDCCHSSSSSDWGYIDPPIPLVGDAKYAAYRENGMKVKIAWDPGPGAQWYHVEWQCKASEDEVLKRSYSQVYGTEVELDLCNNDGPWTVAVSSVNWAGESIPAILFEVAIRNRNILDPNNRPMIEWIGKPGYTYVLEYVDNLNGQWVTLAEGWDGEGLMTAEMPREGSYRVRIVKVDEPPIELQEAE